MYIRLIPRLFFPVRDYVSRSSGVVVRQFETVIRRKGEAKACLTYEVVEVSLEGHGVVF